MREIKKSKNSEKRHIETPFLLAILVFSLAYLINYLLDLDGTKIFFNWCGYYFNLSLYWLNSVLQPAFKNHPYIRIPVLVNPMTPEFMAIINPWMWLRGFTLGSFVVGQTGTLLHVKIIKSKNIAFAAIIIGVLQLCLYACPYLTEFSQQVLNFVIQKFYINIFVLVFVCIIGLVLGVVYADYLLRSEKIGIYSNNKGTPKIKYTDKFDW